MNIKLLELNNTMSTIDVEVELCKLEERFSVEDCVLEELKEDYNG